MNLNMDIITLLLPELFLIVMLLVAVIWAAIFDPLIPLAGRGASVIKGVVKSGRFLTLFVLIILLGLLALPLGSAGLEGHIFLNALAYHVEALPFKKMVVFAAILALLLSIASLIKRQASDIAVGRNDYLMLFGLVLSSLFLISSQHFLAFYLALELQSFAVCLLIALNRPQEGEGGGMAINAAMKYLVLGAVASSLILLGMTILYGITGEMEFAKLGAALTNQSDTGLQIVSKMGMVAIMSGIAFKLSAAPFHIWLADVAQGTRGFVLAVLLVVSKIALLFAFWQMLTSVFGSLQSDWHMVIAAMAVLSAMVGGFWGIAQGGLRRLFACSSIGHMSYMLLALIGGDFAVSSLTFYVQVYLVMTIGSLAVLLPVLEKKGHDGLYSLAGLGKKHPVQAFILLFFLLSLIGLPPLAGFWAKLNIVLAVLEMGYVLPVLLVVFMTVVSGFYYMRLIKVMYFDESEQNTVILPSCRLRQLVIAVCVVLLLCQSLFPGIN